MDQHSQINELTEYDIWFINMAVKISYDKSLQCAYCIEKTSPSVRENRRGCKSFATAKTLKGFAYSKCLGNFYNFGYAQLIELHNRYRSGVLFNTGGLSDQPSKYLHAMALVGNLVHDEEKAIAEAIAKKAKKNGR